LWIADFGFWIAEGGTGLEDEEGVGDKNKRGESMLG
jgi:hypothetical protein